MSRIPMVGGALQGTAAPEQQQRMGPRPQPPLRGQPAGPTPRAGMTPTPQAGGPMRPMAGGTPRRMGQPRQAPQLPGPPPALPELGQTVYSRGDVPIGHAGREQDYYAEQAGVVPTQAGMMQAMQQMQATPRGLGGQQPAPAPQPAAINREQRIAQVAAEAQQRGLEDWRRNRQSVNVVGGSAVRPPMSRGEAATGGVAAQIRRNNPWRFNNPFTGEYLDPDAARR